MSRSIGEDRLADLVDQIYDAAFDPRGWDACLDAVCESFGGQLSLLAHDTSSGAIRLARHVRRDPAVLQTYAAYYGQLYPKLAMWRDAPLGALVWDHATDHGAFYDEWWHPQKITGFLGGVLVRNAGLRAELRMVRPARLGWFSDREVDFFKALLPHLSRAMRIHQCTAATRIAEAGTLDAFGALALGVIVVDDTGRVLFANAPAERLLRAGDALSMGRGGLQAATGDATRALARLIRHAARRHGDGGLRSGGEVVLRRRTGHPLVALVCPMQSAVLAVLEQPAAIVFVSDPDATRVPPARLLAALWGLTPSEAQLTLALVGGVRVADYAEQHGVTLNTAKTHLKRVFNKSGHKRQTELLRELLGNPLLRLVDGGK
ncbi:MAG: hypothetical protein JO021_21050 [Alphaproteobacteria bacterium]|nr:hypothetical protein [Alphaproteobacteria bacterium]